MLIWISCWNGANWDSLTVGTVFFFFFFLLSMLTSTVPLISFNFVYVWLLRRRSSRCAGAKFCNFWSSRATNTDTKHVSATRWWKFSEMHLHFQSHSHFLLQFMFDFFFFFCCLRQRRKRRGRNNKKYEDEILTLNNWRQKIFFLLAFFFFVHVWFIFVFLASFALLLGNIPARQSKEHIFITLRVYVCV